MRVLDQGIMGSAYSPIVFPIEGDRTLALIGDSITAYNINSTKYAVGYITAITNANPCVITLPGHGYATNDEVYHWGINGMTELNEQRYVVTVLNANQYSIPIDSTSFPAYGAGGTTKQGKSFATTNCIISRAEKGYISYGLQLTQQRFNSGLKHNRGISSETSANLVSRLAVSLPTNIGITDVCIMIGTNDLVAGVAPATVAANVQTIIDYCHAQGWNVILGDCPPRNPLVYLNVLDLNDRYDLLENTHTAPYVIRWRYYDLVTDPATHTWYTSYQDNTSGGNVHPSAIGALWMGIGWEQSTVPYYGYGSLDIPDGNLLLNPTFSGTGGTASGALFTNNGIATNWTAGNIGSTAPTKKVLSKNGAGEQLLNFAFAGTENAQDGAYFGQSKSSGLVDNDWYEAGALIALDSFSGTGRMTEFDIYLRSNSGNLSSDSGVVSGQPSLSLDAAQLVTISGEQYIYLKTWAAKKTAAMSALEVRVQNRYDASAATGGSVNSQYRVAAAWMQQVPDPYLTTS